MNSKKTNIIIILLAIGTIIAAYLAIEFFGKSNDDIIRESIIDEMIEEKQEVTDEEYKEDGIEESENNQPRDSQSENDENVEIEEPSENNPVQETKTIQERLKEDVDSITSKFIELESLIYYSEKREWFDDNLQMDVRTYGEGMDIYKVETSDNDMYFEIYYWENMVIFVLATPTDKLGQTNDKGQPIGYRMYFKDNKMIASTDLDFNVVDPNSQDFITMEDFTLRLSYYFYLSYIEQR